MGLVLWMVFGSKRISVQDEVFWDAIRSRPFESRFEPARPELISYLGETRRGLSGLRSGNQDIFFQRLSEVLREVPSEVKNKLERRLHGIALVEGLGVSAQTISVRGRSGGESGAFIVLDQRNLNVSVDQWATHKESRFFEMSHDEKLRPVLANPAEDPFNATLRWVLLHELGHVLQVGWPGVPSFDRRPALSSFESFAFSKLSWEIHGEYFRSRFDFSDFPSRREWPFRSNRPWKLKSSRIPELWAQLRRTNFVTPEAAADPFEDFAESFAVHVHQVYLRKPWRLEWIKAGEVRDQLATCWDEFRCAQKRKLIEELLASRDESDSRIHK